MPRGDPVRPEQPDKDRGEHLPQLRADGRPPDPSWLPRQRVGTTPQMIGRYPDYDVLSQADTWDEATRRVVLRRLDTPGPLRFFTAEQEPALRAFCDVCTGQDREPRVPVAEMVDAKLADGMLDGFQYADMPPDEQVWVRVLAGLDRTGRERHGAVFAGCTPQQQESIVEDLSRGSLAGGGWEDLNVARAWSVCMRAVLSCFYAHPWAWNEIGFGGPAYPRGYMRIGPLSTLEPFERPGATSERPGRAVEEHPQEFPG
ncbi:gluconate 2-dehydrogenase subunit 3 family protein [Ornithinimicrobium avium]|uniref:Gluconate 2-dehydrogenase subunit 3 family protein n=1 Tax=Ornithinimicrobium avium TaxID=2283195 RepID=A0A345NJV5_9MICO|nr:gluconate 2-dehydrogenase subunit 3 family protein [Ornithinimicrobium avium]AXH95313.1 gluconate 2-dehydrogenase subunit 3 family protein [Ornithinimicrobium avium]